MRPVPTSTIVVERRHRRDLGDIEGLAESIERLGQLQPIVVTPERRLIAGERRLRACEHLGIDVHIRFAKTLEDARLALEAERDENLERKNLTHEERYSIYEALLDLERAEASERRVEGAAKGGHAEAGKPRCGTAVPKVDREAGRAATRAAKAAGFASRKEAERTGKILAAAEKNPELQPLVDELNAKGKAQAVEAKLKRAQACGGKLHDPDSYSTPERWVAPSKRAEPGGVFHLDCCTNALAKLLRAVGARVGWTIEDDCLAQKTWDVEGDGQTVLWGQPPYSGPAKIIERFAQEWDEGHILRAYWLVKDDPSTGWYAMLRDRAAVLVIPRERIHHVIGRADDGSEICETSTDFCSVLFAIADERTDEVGLYLRLRREHEGIADAYPTARVVDGLLLRIEELEAQVDVLRQELDLAEATE